MTAYDMLSLLEFRRVLFRSNTQSNITRFICSHWEDPYDAKHLTLNQINIALGGLAKIVAL